MSDKSEDYKKKEKSKTHKGLYRLSDDKFAQVTNKTKTEPQATSEKTKTQQEIGKTTKKRLHQHYHSHDLSDHDHV